MTDAAGWFSFQPVPDGEYELRTARTRRHEGATAVVRAGSDSTVLVIEARSARSLLVRGYVESEGGGALHAVRVEVVGRPAQATTSDESGAYGLRVPVSGRAPEAELRFVRAGYREQRVAIGAEAEDLDELVRDVRLAPTGALGSVSGHVSGDDGRPVYRAAVQLYSSRLGRRAQAVSDRDGSYAIAGVEEADDYRMWVRADGAYRDYVREDVAVGSHGAVIDVVLPSLAFTGLRGAMVDPEGRPVPGFTLLLRPAQAGARWIPVTGDAQGRFAVADLPEGPLVLETRGAPQLSVTGIALAAGAEREVRLALDVGVHRLEGQLVSEGGGEPVGGARIALRWASVAGGLSSRSFRETISDASGRFLFSNLGTGVHTLSATADGFRGARLQHPVGSATVPVRIPLAPVP